MHPLDNAHAEHTRRRGRAKTTSLSLIHISREISIVLTSKTDHAQLSAEEIVGIGRSPYTGVWGTLSTADKQIVASALQETGIQHLAQRKMCIRDSCILVY